MTLLEIAQRYAALVEEESSRIRVPTTSCVVDVHGNIVLKQRMDGALLVSLEIAERKAFTAAALHISTAAIAPLAQPGQDLFPLLAAAGGRFVALGGGLPLRVQGKVVAGVGVSGGTTEQDVSVAEAALKRLGSV